MKLIKRRLERLEAEGRQFEELGERLAAAAGRAAAASAAVGIVWSDHESKLSRPLGEGEHIAYDLVVLKVDGRDVTGSHERASTDPNDLGFVYDEDGRVVGRINMRAAPGLLWWEPLSEDEVPDDRALL